MGGSSESLLRGERIDQFGRNKSCRQLGNRGTKLVEVCSDGAVETVGYLNQDFILW